MKHYLTILKNVTVAVGFAACVSAAQAHDDDSHAVNGTDKKVEVIAEAMQDEAGNPISFPQTDGKIKIAIITLGKDAQTSLHVHDYPLAAYVLEGQLTVDYGTAGKKVFNAGDGIIEAVNWPHQGFVTGGTAVKLVVFYAGKKGVSDSVAVDKVAE